MTWSTKVALMSSEICLRLLPGPLLRSCPRPHPTPLSLPLPLALTASMFAKFSQKWGAYLRSICSGKSQTNWGSITVECFHVCVWVLPISGMFFFLNNFPYISHS
jgi:hypothetical protein